MINNIGVFSCAKYHHSYIRIYAVIGTIHTPTPLTSNSCLILLYTQDASLLCQTALCSILIIHSFID